MNAIYAVIAIVIVAGGAWYFLAGTPTDAPDATNDTPINTVEPRERTSDVEAAPEATEPAATPEPAAEAPVAAEPVVAEPEPAPATPPAAATPDPVSVNISGRNFAFSESEIRVPLGAEVTVNFTSSSGFHDWVVDEFGAATAQVNTGGSASVTFTADKAGTFEYYCSVGNHRAQGMVGNLIVE